MDDSTAMALRSAPAPTKRAALALMQISLAALAGLIVAEGAVRLADNNALFVPAIFVADDDLGVRLRRDTAARLKRRSGAVSTLTLNEQGLRVIGPPGADAPTVVVVGDSQALGYHVNDADVFAARIQAQFGDAVWVSLRAVPTYGPQEYRRVLDAAAAEGPVDAVVVVITAANDWQERATRNVNRTTAQYGFAAHAPRASTTRTTARDPRTFVADALKPLTPYLHLATYAQRGRSDHASAGPRVGPERAVAFARRHAADTEARAMMNILDGAAGGAPLFVASLPMDVEVHRDHEAKYRGANTDAFADLTAVTRLHEALENEARRRGATPISLHEPLRALGAAAYFSDDDHLTPAGHQVLADTLVAPLRAVLFPLAAQAVRPGSLL